MQLAQIAVCKKNMSQTTKVAFNQAYINFINT